MRQKRTTLAVSVGALVYLLLGSAGVSAEPPPGKNYIGINVGAPVDHDGGLMFANAMKSARDWTILDSNGLIALPSKEVDANGWPIVDAAVVVWAGLERDNTGTYQLSFESNSNSVSIELHLVVGTVDRVMHDPKTKRTTAEIVLTEKTGSYCRLSFKNTAGGVRNVTLMRPTAPGSRQSHATTEHFTRSFLAAIAPFQALRFMDYLGTNRNQQKYWNNPSDPILTRTLPNARTYQSGENITMQKAGYGWAGRGGAWEDVINLCNQTGKDAWINVPLEADDDYIRNLAALFHRGNAYTNGIGLKPSIKLYVEYANELWNAGGPFDGNRNHDIAVKEQAKGDPYRYNQAMQEPNNTWYWAFRRVARKLVDISQVFRRQFGDARMMTQIRPVLGWQRGNEITGIEPLHYLESAYLPKIAPQKPVSYFIYGGGGSAYYNPDNESDKLTLSNFWQSSTMNLKSWAQSGIARDAHLCAAFGLKHLAYEGGPSLDNSGHSEDVKAAAAVDPRMGEAVIEHHNTWSEWGGDLLMYYTLVSNYQWGFVRPIEALITPKYRAIVTLSNKPRAEIKHFRAIPNTIAGNQFDSGNSYHKPGSSPGPAAISANEWRSYTVHTNVAGKYHVTVNYKNGSGQIILFSDGEQSAMKNASSSGSITTPVDWKNGVHSIRVKIPSGSSTITTLVIDKTGPK